MKHDLKKLDTLDIDQFGETTFGDYLIKVQQDDMASNPRTEWDNLGTMSCWHSNYNLGDQHNYNDSRDMIFELSGLYEEESTWEYLDDKQYQRCVDEVYKKYIMLPLYLYDHSGITMRTSGFPCAWDSGQVGYIYISLEDVRKEYNVKRVSAKMRKKVEGYLTGEVETYAHFLTGNVYYFTIEREDDDGEVVDIDSCGGWYGDIPTYMFDEIKSYIQHDVENTPQQLDLL